MNRALYMCGLLIIVGTSLPAYGMSNNAHSLYQHIAKIVNHLFPDQHTRETIARRHLQRQMDDEWDAHTAQCKKEWHYNNPWLEWVKEFCDEQDIISYEI